MTTPTPMPAFAPIDKPEVGFVLGVGGIVEVTAACLVVAAGLAVALLAEMLAELLVEDIVVLVENNDKSFCSNSTTTG